MRKNILVVDDSALMRWVISDIIETDGRFRVYAQACNGIDAINELKRADDKIDVIILDINMPKMDGLQFLSEIKSIDVDVKVIVFSTLATDGGKVTIQALKEGAYDFIKKPDNLEDIKKGAFKNRLLDCIALATRDRVEDKRTINKREEKIKIIQKEVEKNLKNVIGPISNMPKKESSPISRPMDNVISESNVKEQKRNNEVRKKVFSDTKKKEEISKKVSADTINTTHNNSISRKVKKRKLIFIATSTGGPNALHEVIPKIDKRIDAPIVVVQHMPKDFTKFLAQRLNEISELDVKEAAQNDVLTKGHVYIAPGGFQLILEKIGSDSARCNICEKTNLVLNPCADETLYSMKELPYDEIICVVLTGMGKDATDGIVELSKYRKVRVIAQDESSSVVYGMPNMIRKAGMVDEIVSLDDVAKTIINYAGVR